MPSSATLSSNASTQKHSRYYSITLVDIMIALIAIELIAGSIVIGKELMEARKVREQIAQISKFNSAVSTFQEKYDGLPGDLLSAQADRVGLPTGDGTPAHSDGDGKLSSCSPGWPDALGCETALFWTQLSVSELITGTYFGNVGFSDNRVEETFLLDNYLPEAVLSPEMYIAVWTADRSHIHSVSNILPDGNYFELTKFYGIVDGKILENPQAISPIVAKEIDNKIDDGRPFEGKVIVNGSEDTTEAGWNNYAKTGPLECVTDNKAYNTNEYLKAHRPLCHLAIAMDCCSLSYPY